MEDIWLSVDIVIVIIIINSLLFGPPCRPKPSPIMAPIVPSVAKSIPLLGNSKSKELYCSIRESMYNAIVVIWLLERCRNSSPLANHAG